LNKSEYKNLSDEDLVREYFKDKKEEIFAEIYTRYNGLIFHYMRKFLYYCHYDEIRELLSEVFIKVYLNIRTLKDLKTFKGWMYQIAHNICINYLKSKKHIADNSDEILEATADNNVNIEGHVVDSEMMEIVNSKMSSFEDDVREILVFKFYNHLTYEEISELLGIPVRSVKYKMKIALEKLGDKLKAAGFFND
jgi:RNA polymerase sigma factor (sigma-70 family)